VLLLRAERGRLPPEDELRNVFSPMAALTIETVPTVSHHLHLEQPQLVADRIVRAWKNAPG
jgi:pimeloyl-ACP methyl ester carboxylesterase